MNNYIFSIIKMYGEFLINNNAELLSFTINSKIEKIKMRKSKKAMISAMKEKIQSQNFKNKEKRHSVINLKSNCFCLKEIDRQYFVGQ